MEDTGVGVKALVVDQGHCLFLVKHDGSLDLPGGRVEPNETLEQAIKREIEEEAGFKVRILAEAGSCPYVAIPESNRSNHNLYLQAH